MKYTLYLLALAASGIATAVIAPQADAAGGSLYRSDFTKRHDFQIQPRRDKDNLCLWAE